MRKILFCSFVIVIFLFFSCNKKNTNCLDVFNELYVDRYSLWFNFEKDEENLIGYDNHTIDVYKARKKEINDSLSLMIDCALKENQDNEVLYIYKMKSLFLNDQLREISIFFNGLNHKKISKIELFQLSLYEILSDEILNKKIKIAEYQKLKKIWVENNLEEITENYTINIVLDYLIDDNKEKFFKNLERQGIFDVEEISDKNREEIIKNIMVRADGFVFD